MKSPYPYFGGKSKAAPIVWARFGDVRNFIDPFFGSNAMLLSRPEWHKRQIETINDSDGMVSNFWRAVAAAPDEVAHFADWAVNENDLHARHWWLINQRTDLHARLEGDPEFYDAKIAGWWVWGMASWIGSGFCSGKGAWASVDGKLVKVGRGISQQLPHLGDGGRGINRQLPSISRNRGINRQRPQLGNGGASGQGINAISDLQAYMRELQARMRRVRVASGDWTRVLGRSVTYKLGETAVFLDPPYADEAGRMMGLYTNDSGTVAHEVRKWAIENGDNPKMKIALCGYDVEHGDYMPDSWEVVEWQPNGGFDGQRKGGRSDNHLRERIWFSPHCLRPSIQRGLFGA